MISNRLAFGLLGLACVVAAAGGGYLARQNTVATPAAASTMAEPTAPAAAVQETEAVVGEPVAPAPVAPPPSPAASSPRLEPAKRAEPARRPEPARASKPAQTSARAETSQPQTPALERAWPTTAEPAAPPAPPVEEPSAPAVTEEHQVAIVPAEPERTFDELVVSADSVVGLQIENALTSERAKVEDRVDARVVRDVRVGGQTAIPAGSRVEGSVTVVEKGGKFKERARLGIRFHTIVLADGTRLQITTDTIYRYGDAPGNASAAKVGGGAVAGAILGAILGGAKGAAIGAAAGAGGGTAATMAGDASVATFPAGTELTARILSPVSVTVEQ